ncbi:molybdopterin-synthase adenylyltransferase MoeB [Planctomonas psychrotolerans]|uniref:molybdopterin-synthase adenylyltransferase MoeB n=1 Tax=Planctomonas psychrotolerans TaxID=2528712 RepID=UPI00123B7620|nr:molybdopterin-synthase adenylyltransferase MoeB [Planctomonas psychrotolerans]
MGSLPPLVEPSPELSGDDAERYSRQVMLPGMGTLGQRRLRNARVLVIGAGGLGSPVLQYLAAAGIGTLGIVDFDQVDLSNLQRQVIHGLADVGGSKTASAERSIDALNPGVRVVRHEERLTSRNAGRLFAGYDLVVDGTDNFPTRYLANDAAALAGIPYVWGSVYRFDGQVSVFWDAAPDGRGLDFRDLFPEPPAPGTVLSCAEAGVFGAVCASVGAVLATEVIKLVTGVGEPLLGRVLVIDALDGSRDEIPLRRRADRTPVSELIDYDAFCGIDTGPLDRAPSITAAELRSRLAARDAGRDDFVLLDVRERVEHDLDAIAGDVLMPQADVMSRPDAVPLGATPGVPAPVIVYCRSGMRSAVVTEALRASGRTATYLRGGIVDWRRTPAGGVRS